MKKIISFVLAVLLVLSIVSSKALPVSAATLEGTPSADDVEDVLDDIISISNNLKSVGFSIEDITGLLQLSEGSAGYGADAHIENIGNENTIQALYNYDGNPPSSDAEQKERIVDAFAMALSVPARNYYQGSLMTADELGNFVVYLYLSNYVDGPGRAPTMNDLPYIITTYDITAYNNFLSVSNAASLFNGLSSFASSLYSTSTFVNDAAAISDFSDDIADLAALIYAAGNGVYDAEQLHAAYDLISDKVVWYTNQNAADINDDVEVFINDTIDYVHTELAALDFYSTYSEEFTSTVTGYYASMAWMLATNTVSMLNFGIAAVPMFTYSFTGLLANATLAGLGYTFSSRFSMRLSALYGL